ncbi:AlpA family phage regulatory protein [Mesorhizobium sp.]|uniref:helix-turn-helix transcriptional regulator n=1 Tax=Mesorhizobium sp. TaxID=1871066 RepID=UPI002579637B|nr:AlpA family phage regulatory protein [Mesorhizobium sp.]
MGERFVGKKELQQLVSISPQHIDRMEKAGLFPSRIRLGPGRVAWLYSEVRAWMDAKIAESRAA